MAAPSFVSGLRRKAGFALLFGLLGAFAFHVAWTLLEVRREADLFATAPMESGDVLQLQTDYHRLMGGLAAFAVPLTEVDRDELMLRFDLVWARADTLTKGEAFALFREEAGVIGVVEPLLATLAEIEPAVAALEPGDAEAAAGIRAELLPHDTAIARLAAQATQVKTERVAAMRRLLIDMLERLQQVSAVFAIAVATTIAVLIRESVRAKRALATLQAREDSLRFLAHHDPLTQLSNRVLLRETLDSLLGVVRPEPISLLVLDLDGFKEINDTFGHPTGDRLLVQVSRRLLELTSTGSRRGEKPLVARLGGDEFALLAGDQPEPLAKAVIEAMARPFKLDGRELCISTSIGIARAPRDARSSDDLLRHADLALYAAKASGRGSFQFFEAVHAERLSQRRQIEAGLRTALREGQFSLHYQPIVELDSGRPVAVEALLRWTHPVLGPIAPDTFIQVAEEAGMILDIGRWVLERACAEAATWRGPLAEVRLCVNVAPTQFLFQDMVGEVRRALDGAGLPPHRLLLEITEGTLMRDTEATIAVLDTLARMGVGLAIDDFGMGYSSLGYLKRFRLDHLKIDRSFVEDIETDADDHAIVRSIVSLARALELTVVAEGIETEGQRGSLEALGCDLAQGFLFARPMDGRELARTFGPAPEMETIEAPLHPLGLID